MKRKLFVVLMTMAMLFAYMPALAYADADTETANDAVVENEQLTDEELDVVGETAEQIELTDDTGEPPVADEVEPADEEEPEEVIEEPVVEEPAADDEGDAIEPPTDDPRKDVIAKADKLKGPDAETKGDPSGWVKKDGKWHYYDPEYGYEYTDNWYRIGEYAYYFDKDGAMLTGWIKYIDISYDSDGEEYKEVKWYYADSSGHLLSGFQTISGKIYYFDPEYYYMWYDQDGDFIWTIEENYYYVLKSGEIKTGWIKVVYTYEYDDETYTDSYYMYAESDGRLVADNWKKISNKWYYFNWCYMVSDQRYEINGKTYYFAPSGEMKTGWIKRVWDDEYYDWYYADSNGVLKTKWQKIDGKWYYFDPDYFEMYYGGICEINGKDYFFDKNGVLASGWAKRVYNAPSQEYGPKDTGTEWYYTDSNGVVKYGWQTIGGKKYYFDLDDGYMYYDGYYEIDGNHYYFAESGALQTGWIKESYTWIGSDGVEYSDTDWYYADKNGVLQTGWQKIGGKKYYFNPYSFYMYVGYYTIDSTAYVFDKNGVLVEKPNGWVEDYGDWLYFKNGKPVTGWQKIGSKWYYFNTQSSYAYMYVGYHYIEEDGKYYYFNENGVYESNPSGWKQLWGGWMYFEKGAPVTGWKKLSGKWYYFNTDPENAYMYVGYRYVYEDDKYYFFNKSGVYESNPSGWKQIATNYWYYFSGGEPVTGWKKISNKWYYFDSDGWMYKGWYEEDDDWYYFDENGVMLTGTHTINGIKYTFNKSGKWDGK